MPFNLGILEMVVIFLVVLLLFGAKRLPEIGTSLGKGIREFKSSVREIETSVRKEAELQPPREDASAGQASEAGEKAAPRRLTPG
ncbi:MAG: twin-arginine translocase TatA/TatE family subunit [Gemmatimonadota bacterium]|nr:twin-arginine translocase TatA/TatE family subunit [Gemmatimonadota bacterium]MDE2984369.1 twin-arginine translocase TatA/TatE family subunit [Gemmatimonadota bacterium]